MAILYALVARGTVLLAEFSAVTGNAGDVARRILEKLPAEADSRLCFSQDRYIFHILRSDGLTYVCMANDTFGSELSLSFLIVHHLCSVSDSCNDRWFCFVLLPLINKQKV